MLTQQEYRNTTPDEDDYGELIEALIKYVNLFNNLVEKRGIENYKKTIDSMNKYFFEMDRKYYAELEGKPNDMRDLVEHLNGVPV